MKVTERMNALKTILYSIVLFIAKPSNSFPPDENGLTGSAANTKHHKEITSFAIQMAVVTYIQINNLSVVDDSSDPSTKLQDFFGDGEYTIDMFHVINVGAFYSRLHSMNYLIVEGRNAVG